MKETETHLPVLCNTKHGLLPPSNDHWVEFTESFTELGCLDLVSLHTPKLATVVVPPPIDREGVAQWDIPVLWVPGGDGGGGGGSVCHSQQVSG